MEDAPAVYCIEDTTMNPMFENCEIVIGPPYIRFYAGAPLIMQGDIKIGTLCIMDSKVPRIILSLIVGSLISHANSQLTTGSCSSTWLNW